MAKNMEKEFITINQQEVNTKDSGSMTKNMVMVLSNMPMEIAMKEIGGMDKDQKMESMNTLMEMFMMESGKMT